MTRRKRPRFNGAAADHAATEQWLSQLHTGPEDGTTIRFTGASIVGLPEDVTAIAIQAGPAPLAGYRPAPASFPALQAAPEPEPAPVLAPVPLTVPAIIGDYLRLPVVWCEMGGCINWRLDRESAGERDARERAIDAGWCTDALGRLACPQCQQGRADYRTPLPVAWHHPEVARRWHAREPLSDTGAFRLGVEAELGRRVSRENPALARAIAARHAQDGGVMSRDDVMTDRAAEAVTLARATAAQVREIGALIRDLAEGADLAMAGGEPAKVVAYRMITACRMIAKATRGEPVTT